MIDDSYDNQVKLDRQILTTKVKKCPLCLIENLHLVVDPNGIVGGDYYVCECCHGVFELEDN